VLLDSNDLFVLIKKDQVDWKQHSDRVHAAGRNDPEARSEASPPLCLPKQSYEPAHVAVRHRCFRSNERLARLVIDVHRVTAMIVSHGRHLPLPQFEIGAAQRVLIRSLSRVAAR